jgi:hypothetical protein
MAVSRTLPGISLQTGEAWRKSVAIRVFPEKKIP